MFDQVRWVVADVNQGSLKLASDGEVVALPSRVLLVVLGESLVLRGAQLLQLSDTRS